jgi:hypothetical protein
MIDIGFGAVRRHADSVLMPLDFFYTTDLHVNLQKIRYSYSFSFFLRLSYFLA